MKIEIKDRYTDAVIYTTEADSVRAAVLEAVGKKTSLARANLAGANLADADLAGANLAGANLAGANLAGAYLAGAKNVPEGVAEGQPAAERLPIPVIEKLPQKILDAIAQPGCSLEMSSVHVCGTTHCIAGWTTTLAGEAGKALEEKHGWSMAASMIWHKSFKGPRPHFYGSNDRAMEQLQKCAAKEAATAE